MTSTIVPGRRVVITGMGVISPVGLTTASFWQALVQGRSGIAALEGIDLEGEEVRIGAQAKDFDPLQYMDRKEARRSDRCCQFAVAAAVEAMKSSGLDVEAYGAGRVGTIIGSGGGGLGTIETEYKKLYASELDRISPLAVPMMITNMAAAKVSMIYGTLGTNFCVVSACASGAHSIGEAFRAIKYGYIDACITGGTEAPVTRFSIAAYNNMNALSREPDPARASIPFDARRSGFVIGEGAGILILESLDTALARGADIICELAGFGASADAYHITSPDPEGKGATLAMKMALMEAGAVPADVDYINAHGTSTPLNDKYETLAIKKVFGETARKVAISSTKSMTGHLLGAAGAIEAIATALALRDGIIPPTIGLYQADPECDLDYVPNAARHTPIRLALSNSFGFGGQNGVLCLKKWEKNYGFM
jgi:3-oxoacyl-[acyl-carrier-protein] synthase II